MYALGIDLGTTFTAAAVWRDGRSEISALGSRSAAIPSVVVLREDETIITGESANRRALTAPHRVAREFKRRLGDTTPILLGGVPYSAEALMSRVLQAVVEEVSTREGGRPDLVCVSHPANWGAYKTDLLHQAIRGADLENVRLTTEPEAAAAFYARQQRIPEGAVVAVYDLGGGTFDAAVLRKTAAGFEILGRPEGIERLGGIDFDAAVFAHVSRALGGALAELDDEDPATIAAVGRLKEECTEAKEALSSDTDTTIPVLLPNLTTEVRLTRAELEAMVRPALQDSIDAMRRALRSAQITPEQLHSILLVGGSSRIPVVAELVGAEFGRPVAVDVHPKHAVALGAAVLASGESAGPGALPSGGQSLGASPVGGASPVDGASPVGGQSAGGPTVGDASPVGGQPDLGRARPIRSDPLRPDLGRSEPVRPAAMRSENIPSEPLPVADSAARSGFPPVVRPEPSRPVPEPTRPAPEPARPAPESVRAVPEPAHPAPLPIGPTPSLVGFAPVVDPASVSGPGSRLRLLSAIGVGTVAVIALSVVGYTVLNGDDHSATSSSGSAGPATCTSAITANPRWVCLKQATFANNTLTIVYDAAFGATDPSIEGGYHLHIYGDQGKSAPPSAAIEGLQARYPGHWYTEDTSPSVRGVTSDDYTTAITNASKLVCARIATADDVLVKDLNGTFETGNCIPIQRS